MPIRCITRWDGRFGGRGERNDLVQPGRSEPVGQRRPRRPRSHSRCPRHLSRAASRPRPPAVKCASKLGTDSPVKPMNCPVSRTSTAHSPSPRSSISLGCSGRSVRRWPPASCGAGKCSITAGSAFSAANGSWSRRASAAAAAGRWSVRSFHSVGILLMAWSPVAHRYCTAYARHGRQARACVDQQLWGPRATRGRGRRTGCPDRWPRRRPGRRARASRSTRPSTGRCRAARPVAPGPGPSPRRRRGRSRPRARVAISVVSVVRRDFGNASVSGSSSASACIVGNRVGQPAGRVVDRLAVRLHQPARVSPGRRRRHLLAEHRAYGELLAVDRARHPAAGRLDDQRREHRVGAEQVVDRDRVRVEVEHPAAAADRDREVALVGERELAGDVVRHRPQRDDTVAVRQPQRAAVARRRATPRRPVRRSRSGGRTGCPGVSGARNGSRSEIVPGAVGRRTPAWPGCAARSATSAKTSCTVSLKVRTLEKPAANATSAICSVARLDQQPRGLRPLRPGERERPGAELGLELALHLADAVAEVGREARYAVAVDDAVARSAASRAQPGRRGRSTPASPGWRRGGTACRRGTRPAGRPRRSGRTACSRPSAAPPGSSAGSRSWWSAPR